MNLKPANVVALALVGLAVSERAQPRVRRAFLLGAALLDGFVLFTLMTERHAATIATHLPMTPVRLIHVGASALFPIFYPFLLLDAPGEEPGGRAAWPLYLFATLRLTSFLTSYFMAAASH